MEAKDRNWRMKLMSFDRVKVKQEDTYNNQRKGEEKWQKK